MKLKFFTLLFIFSTILSINNFASIKFDYNKTISNSSKVEDSIFLKKGLLVVGKVEEISTNKIKYRIKDNQGPLIVLRANDVVKIKYSDGTITDNTGTIISNIYPVKKNDTLGILSSIFAIIGLIVAGLPLGLTSVILGSIALTRDFANPKLYKGKAWAILGIIIGMLDIIAILIFLGLI